MTSILSLNHSDFISHMFPRGPARLSAKLGQVRRGSSQSDEPPRAGRLINPPPQKGGGQENRARSVKQKKPPAAHHPPRPACLAARGDADLRVTRGPEHLDLHVFQGSQDVPKACWLAGCGDADLLIIN